MAVTEYREEEHESTLSLTRATAVFSCGYGDFGGQASPRLRPSQAMAVMSITAKRDARHPRYLAFSACCSQLFPPFASAGANHLHSDFATAFAAVRQRMPRQEPFGNPRPQALFFPGFAPSSQ